MVIAYLSENRYEEHSLWRQMFVLQLATRRHRLFDLFIRTFPVAKRMDASVNRDWEFRFCLVKSVGCGRLQGAGSYDS